jgi:hypothetical protein
MFHYLLIFFLISLVAPIESVHALVPIESLVLGNFAETYSEAESDPLSYVFGRDKFQPENKSYKRELALYRGFSEEGKNTQNYCKINRQIRYRSEWEKVQVMRSMLSEIQYIGLDITARAIPQYAKALEFSREEYINLIDGLVGNFCSANLSVISKKELRNNLVVKFDKANTFKLPDVTGNPYFPDNLNSYFQPKIGLEQEFKYTIKLFQSICSWGGNPTKPGLMQSILKHPALMSFFVRQMNNQVIEWKELDNTLFLKEDQNTVQVWCDNLICRKSPRDKFLNKIYYSMGGTNFGEDLKRLYCEDFRLLDSKASDYDERLGKIINSRTLDEENFINSQFIALLTGVPDFLLRADKFTSGEDILRSSMDYTWSKWARAQTETLNRELYFEEPMTLELVQRDLYFNPRKPEIKVAFDVNLGEFDRINQRTGKVRVSFNILIQKSFLHYYRETLKNLDSRNSGEKERLLKRFKMQITKDLTLAREKFIIPPWKGDLESLIAGELTEQLQLISDRNFVLDTTGFEPIKVELNYGLFALKYINHQKTVQNARIRNSK